MSIVTRTGDRGLTSLFGGERVSKASARMHACGSVDELNAALGIALTDQHIPERLRSELTQLQHTLFRAGADLGARPEKKTERITPEHVQEIERWIDRMEPALPPQTSFILPGGSPASAELHLARTICRRAERWIVALQECEPISPDLRIFFNRLSDYLFLAARTANAAVGVPDVKVTYTLPATQQE